MKIIKKVVRQSLRYVRSVQLERHEHNAGPDHNSQVYFPDDRIFLRPRPSCFRVETVYVFPVAGWDFTKLQSQCVTYQSSRGWYFSTVWGSSNTLGYTHIYVSHFCKRFLCLVCELITCVAIALMSKSFVRWNQKCFSCCGTPNGGIPSLSSEIVDSVGVFWSPMFLTRTVAILAQRSLRKVTLVDLIKTIPGSRDWRLIYA